MTKLSSILTVPTSELGYGYDLQLYGWCEGMSAYRAYPSGEKELIEGNIGLALDIISAYSQGDSTWLNEIPSHLLDMTLRFPQFQHYMLQLASQSQQAQIMLVENPILLALICKDCSSDLEHAIGLVERDDLDILARLSLDPCKDAIRFLCKLDLGFGKGDELQYIANYLKPEKALYNRFAQYDVINDNAFNIDRTFPELTDTNLGRAFSDRRVKFVWGRIGFAKETLKLGKHLNINDPLKKITDLNCYDDLKILREEWSNGVRQLDEETEHQFCLSSID